MLRLLRLAGGKKITISASSRASRDYSLTLMIAEIGIDHAIIKYFSTSISFIINFYINFAVSDNDDA